MPNQQINSITSATTTDGSELLPVVSGGVTKSVSVSTINSGIAADAVSDVYEARDLAVGQSSIAAAAALAAGSIAQQDLTAVSAALHRSPNAVTSMFVYDTSKDSDGGAWTEKCQHTSWYNEPLGGKWLGAQPNDLFARCTSTGRGSNVLTNPTFDSNVQGYTFANGATMEWADGKAKMISSAGTQYATAYAEFANPAGLKLNTLYEVSVDIYPGTYTGNVVLNMEGSNAVGGVITASATTAQTLKTFMVPLGSGNKARIRFENTHTSGQYFFVDNFVFKEVMDLNESNSFYQSTVDGKFYRLWKNLFLDSSGTTGSWNNYGTASQTMQPRQTAAPDGSWTGILCTNNTGQCSTFGFGTFTYSFSFKKGSATTINLSWAGLGVDPNWTFNFNTLSFTVNSLWKNATVTDEGNGWYRLSATTNHANLGNYYFSFYTGNAGETFYTCNAQVEYGEKQTSYEARLAGGGTVTEVSRGNKREFPKLSAFIEESGSLTIYDLTESGRPMWMRFDKAGSFRMPMGIGVANGTFSGYNVVSAIQIVSFCYDSVRFINSGGNYLYGNIANRNLTTFNTVLDSTTKVLSSNSRAYKTYVYATPLSTSIGGNALPNATVFNLNNTTIDVFRSNGSYVTLGGAGTSNSLGLPVRIRNSDFLYLSKYDAGPARLYYLNNPDLNSNNPTNLIADISTSEFGRAGLPAKFISDDKSKFYKFVSGYPLIETNSVNIAEPTKTISSAITNTYNTGHMVGDIRRTYLADTAVGSVYSPALTMQNMITTAQQGVWYDPSDINLTWRRNLLTYTEQFDNAAWVKTATTVSANATTDPLGTSTADKLVASATTNWHLASQNVIPANTAVRFSVYAKAAEETKVVLGDYAGLTGCVFDLTAVTATISGTDASVTLSNATIEAVGGGWYRCSVTILATSTKQACIYLRQFSSSYAGDGTSGIYIWGAQLELGSTATPYQRITDGIKDYLDYKPLPILYQDAAGTLPVTAVEQPVGLMLDKSKGLVLGPELVTNGDFSNGTTGWTINGANVTQSVVSGELQVSRTTSPGSSAQSFSVVAGKTYRAVAVGRVISGASTGGLTFRDGAGVTSNILGQFSTVTTTSTANLAAWFTATSTGTVWIHVTAANGTGTVGYDNISVRELPGNHAFNSSGNSANFPVLSARYNLLTKTEAFADAAWTKGSSSAITSGTETAPNGTATASLVTCPLSVSSLYQGVSVTGSTQYRFSFYAKRGTMSDLKWSVYGTAGFVGEIVSPTTYYADVGSDWTLVTKTFTTNAASTSVNIYLLRDSIATGTVYLWGADLRVTNDALNQPAYQRVNTATDYDTVGFKPYLRFNGTNQWLQTNNIDFTYGDKMFVSAGVRKLSDALYQVPFELSDNIGANSGTFIVHAPDSASTYLFRSRGSALPLTAAVSSAIYPPPITNVVSGIGNISGDQAILRVNGSQAAISTADQGTGNYGAYPLYIGARAGTSLWFNGRLYQLVIVNKIPTADELKSTETTINRKTLAYAEQ